MGLIFVLISAVGAFRLYSAGGFFMWLSIVAAAISFWSLGVMHNYAVQAAEKRKTYTGGFYDFTPAEANAIPNRITDVNMVSSLIGLALCIYSFFV